MRIRSFIRRVVVAAPVVAAALVASPATPQMVPHGMRGPARTLHERLRLADAIAVGSVESVDIGRIAMAEITVLRGNLPSRFEIKRSPNAPPPLDTGHRALLLLRGARSPYVLVDEPSELVVFTEPAAEATWRDEIVRLDAVTGDSAAMRSIYLGWIDGDDDTLRELAVNALVDPSDESPHLTPEGKRERARIAIDPRRTSSVRRASAILAVSDDAALAVLIDSLSRDDADAGVAEVSLGVATLRKLPGTPARVAAALDHPDPGVRRAAVRVGGSTIDDPAVAAGMTRVAESDPNPELRALAASLLRRAGAGRR